MSFKAIEKACAGLPDFELVRLKENLESYLQFRKALDRYQKQYFDGFCREACFDDKLSACCGFESIITFFADQVITFLLSTWEEIEALFRKLEQPNTTARGVYLGKRVCLWRVSPISCAMFYCAQAKRTVFNEDRRSEAIWGEFGSQEKEYTLPTKRVLFDDLERVFINLGVDSPHMYFHKSPGLLRLKSRSGLQP
jgi:hypothetical protein